MDDSIEWKEAKGGQDVLDSETEEELDAEADHILGEEEEDWADDDNENEEDTNSKDVASSEAPTTSDSYSKVRHIKTFSYKNINLCLRRNITALADANQHKAKLKYASDSQSETFDSWINNALVSISPNADIILFSGQSPEKVTFYAKLRMEPINQYVIKPLEIPLDSDEQVTSLLCLPIMSSQKTSLGLVDWTCLVVALSTGYVKFYTEQSICLLSLKFCDEPVLSLKCQTQKNNLNGRSETHFATIVDEILITFRSLAICIDGLELYDNLRIAKAEVVKNGFNYEPAYTLTNIPSILNCQKWRIDNSRGSMVVDGDLLGTRRVTTFDSLLSDSINFENLASKACTRTVAFAGRDPFISCYRESAQLSSHSYTEIIGSIFSLWNKPQPSRTQLVDAPGPISIELFDKDRLATSIVSSPDKRLAAVTDDFGRVMLMDTTNWLVVRVWKGYRSAQCGWIEVKRVPDQRDCPHASFLVIYAPKRGLLEVWSVQRGPRVAAFNVGKNCRLLYSGYKMLNMRAESVQRNGNSISQIEQSYSSHCYLLNAKSETVFSVELPYTYSLYKYGDLKSRDHLLMAELITAIQQDSEVELISEIVHRVALANSIQLCVRKIANGLNPDKIVLIMENLINKTMRNYDNHSGEPMNNDDKSIINLCKCLLRLCSIFKDLSESVPNDLTLPDVNQRLIYQYEEHPQEIDELSEKLGWSTSEILRYLSLLSLDRSYRKTHLSNPWPNLGEPLSWSEFVSCFDLRQVTSNVTQSKLTKSKNPDKIVIALKEFNAKFLNEDRVIKTSLFMYNRLSESYYKVSHSKSASRDETSDAIKQIANSYNYLEPSSRLALLLQFWLSTKLCNDWKMWSFLQDQVGQISDELKVIAMEQNDDRILVETWKQIYNLILESDSIYAAMIATAAIKSDTLRMIQDNEKREKLANEQVESGEAISSSIDWECLCIDAERMSLLSEELEDVFLLSLLLKYCPNEGHLVDRFFYRLPRVSVANILRGGPTIVTELVSQWAVQSSIDLKVFINPYGSRDTKTEEEDKQGMVISGSLDKRKLFVQRSSSDHEEQAKELLHHTKASFPCSLEPNVLLMNCVWEYCRQWTSNTSTVNKGQCLKKVFDCLSLLSTVELRHKLASVAYKTFFQRTFERLVVLVETNSSVVSAKSSRLRDTLTRKELGIGEECLEDFVQFCCDLSGTLLQTCCNKSEKLSPDDEAQLRKRLLAHDPWWTTPTLIKMLHSTGKNSHYRSRRKSSDDFSLESSSTGEPESGSSSLVRTILSAKNPVNVEALVDLNSLASLMNLIFRLKIVRAYPMSLIGQESRQALEFDLQRQVPASALSVADLKYKSCSLQELRLKFARKCILNVVAKMTDETNEFNEDDDDDNIDQNHEDIGTKTSTYQQQKPLSHKDTNTGSGGKALMTVNSSSSDNSAPIGASIDATNDDDDDLLSFKQDENNESMVLFGNLLTLATDWGMNCDELHLELVFELYRCNHDKIANQISTRILDQQTLANGLLKISSQRVLVLFGLSPNVSSPEWRSRNDKWSIFQPNVAGWLKSIQQEEMRREIAGLSFSDSLKTATINHRQQGGGIFGLQTFVLKALRQRTLLVLDRITNHLEGQASRLAYDLIQLLESHLFDKLLLESADH